MALPLELQAVLTSNAAESWELMAPVLPREVYLIGGTALAVHLHHRVSRDLDFCFHKEVDLDRLAATLQDLGPFAITLRDEGTLNGLFSETKIQFLSAVSQELLEQPTDVAGV